MFGQWRGALFWRVCLCAAMIGAGGHVQAAFHAWIISEIYSNANGTIQFIEMRSPIDGQQFLSGHNIKVTDGATTKTVVFPPPDPVGPTANKKFLIGSAGFKALGIVTPDYDMPNGFLFLNGGTLTFSDFYDSVSYPALPLDGTQSLNRIGNFGSNFSIGPNSPTNYAGNTGSIVPANAAPGAPTNVIVSTAGIGELSVAFLPPASDGGSPITTYRATCGAQNVTNNTAPILVTGLPNGVPISCMVIASNAVGPGPASAPSASVTPLGLPFAPIIGIAVAGNSLVSISFTPPANTGGSPITGYTATCGAQSAFGGFPPIIVAGLANGVAVTCRVFATNAQGNGALSAASNNVTPATTPGAPIIGLAAPGNASAAVAFSAPTSDGGSPILSYTASCTNGGNTILVTGTASPLYVLGMTNGSVYTCNVKASNALGTGTASSDVIVTPANNSLLSSVVSRKLHNGVERDLPITFALPPGAPPTVEPRLIGNGHRIVFQSNFATASLPAGIALAPNVGNTTATVVGNELIVTLTGVADNQRVTLTLIGYEGTGQDESVTIGFLAGDVSGSGGVNAGDISSVKARIGQVPDVTNFKFDLNASGDISAADVSVVKARAGKTLP